MKTTHILFDFDGTLVDSAPAILSTFAEVLHTCGLQACRSIDSTLIGPPLRQTLEALSGQSDPQVLDALSSSFREIYDAQICLTTPAYPGWSQILQALRSNGFTLAIATNKRLLPTRRILEALGWEAHFAFVYASDSSPQLFTDKTGMIGALLGALRIAPEAAIYLGDTVQDGCAAAANGVEFWPVAWGYGRFAEAQAPLTSPKQLTDRLAGKPA